MSSVSRVLLALGLTLAGSGTVLEAAAQQSVRRGATAAAYGRCATDVLTPDKRELAAALGALAPDVADTLSPNTDPLDTIVRMCAQQLHAHRCSAQIVAVAGDVLVAANPAGRAAPPQPDSTALFGAVAGGVLGAIAGSAIGSNRSGALVGPGTGAVIGTAGGMWAGSKAVPGIVNTAKAGSCVTRQRELDIVSRKLVITGGRAASLADIDDVIEDNLQQGHLTENEAGLIYTEASRLAAVAEKLLSSLR